MKTIQKEKRIWGRKNLWQIYYGIDGQGCELCFRICDYAFDLQILHVYFYVYRESL